MIPVNDVSIILFDVNLWRSLRRDSGGVKRSQQRVVRSLLPPSPLPASPLPLAPPHPPLPPSFPSLIIWKQGETRVTATTPSSENKCHNRKICHSSTYRSDRDLIKQRSRKFHCSDGMMRAALAGGPRILLWHLSHVTGPGGRNMRNHFTTTCHWVRIRRAAPLRSMSGG